MKSKEVMNKLDKATSLNRTTRVFMDRAHDKFTEAFKLMEEGFGNLNVALGDRAHLQAIIDDLKAPYLKKEVLKREQKLQKLKGGKRK